MVNSVSLNMQGFSSNQGVFLKCLTVFISIILHQSTACSERPVGIANSTIIPDDRFTASSYYDTNGDTRYEPKDARLNGADRGWGPKMETDPNDYLQIDLGHVYVICAVATQGANGFHERTTQYKILTSINNAIWTTYKNGQTDKLFPGNTDDNNVVKNILHYPVVVRYIRFVPTTYNSWKVLRVEAYGVRKGCQERPVGIAESSIIPDDRFTASSYYVGYDGDTRYEPKEARLNGAERGWAPKTTTDANDYLQIDLDQVCVICAFATQGANGIHEWTTQYKISTSVDNSTWTIYQNGSNDKLFPGNTDGNTVVKNVLDYPVVARYIRFIPTSYDNWKVLRVEAYGFRRGCQERHIGIADRSIIPDDRFTASSYYVGYDGDTRYEPKEARLDGAQRGWAPKTTTDPNDYLQIDLGQVYVICAVTTQGANRFPEWTTQYKISTSVDNNIWITHTNGQTDKLFPGNTDSNTVVKNVLDYSVLVRHIRFIPTTYNKWKVLRVEAYGVRRGLLCSSLPVGIGSGNIPDIGMTSSSAYNSTTSPSKARLNYIAGSSWCAARNDSSPYLQINLGSTYIICGIATQGDHMTDQWVQSYHMLTSNDGSTFTKYMDNSQVKSFTGNLDSNTAVKNLLLDGTVTQYIRVAPTSHFGSTNCLRTELYGIMKHIGACASMVFGLSYSSIIPDHRFTASSYYDNRYKPHFARLSTSSKAWGPLTTSGGDWLQVDLGSVVFVCAVATQGAGDLNNEWTISYKIKVSLDNVNWDYYQENNINKTFTGNTNRDQVVIHSLSHPIKAKFIRIYPLTFHSWPSLRVEVYGVSSTCSTPVGLQAPGVIQDIQMTSLSNLDNNHTASHGRLYGSSSWCSGNSNNTQYIQINLGQAMTVTGIATQGDHIMDRWVTNYTISYSMVDNLWHTFKSANNSDKIFQGNSDKENVRVQWLSHPLTAIHVRFTPQAWKTAICMRLELYVCAYDYPLTLAAPTVHDINSTSVAVRWIQPALNASQASVTTYVLQYQNITHTQTISVSAPATSHVITGLAIYTNYSVQIKAINRIGSGQWSATTDFRTDSALPVGFPYSVAAVSKTSQSIHVTWLAPTSGINGPFLGYRVFCTSGNEKHENTSQQTSYTFSGLRQGTVYNVTVVIRNDKGDGPIKSYVLVQTLQDGELLEIRLHMNLHCTY